ncbi:MAG: type II toxin-antitoxin system HicA family toxin [Alphaproteobacteria bacterium]|nr:type II toxin-antitoxin system HicA family toxin [Alphaproteobacteria bacterium]
MASSKHQRTWDAIFETPTRADIAWREIEAMLKAMGAEITEGNGSRVRVALSGVRAVFHRPHPRKEADKGAVRAVQMFLLRTNMTRH